MAEDHRPAPARLPRYCTELYGMRLRVPLKLSEVGAMLTVTVALGVVLAIAVRALDGFLFPEPTALRAVPVVGACLLASAPLIWATTFYRPADAATRQAHVTGR